MTMKYKRILLKLSGEALAGQQGHGIDFQTIETFADEIKSVYEQGVEIAIVIGGGNIHRGVAGATKGIDRTSSDHMGMLGTVINALALQDVLERKGVFTRVLSALEMQKIAEPYIRRRAIRHLEKKRVIIFAAGTGNPYFTTDTAAALRSSEIEAEVILKATKVDGVYTDDPVKNPQATRYEKVSFSEAMQKNLKIMDMTALALCRENKMNIIVFNVFASGNILKVAQGENVGTLVTHCED